MNLKFGTKNKQAEDELCQAQLKLELGFTSIMISSIKLITGLTIDFTKLQTNSNL